MLRFLRRLFIGTLVVAFLLALGGGGLVAAVLLKPWRWPRQYRDQTPATLQINSEDVVVDTPDGVMLSGWWALHPDAHGRTVILCHAFGADRRQVLPYFHFLFMAGFNVLAFDWRNHGQSPGRVTTYGLDERQDLLGAFAFLANRADLHDARVAVMGLSFGASMALLAAPDADAPRALVLDSPYADLYQIVRERVRAGYRLPEFPWVPLGMFLAEFIGGFNHHQVRPLLYADRVTTPALFIAGQQDRETPPSHTLALFRRVKGPKELWLVPRTGHLAAYQNQPQRYEDTVVDFLKRNLG